MNAPAEPANNHNNNTSNGIATNGAHGHNHVNGISHAHTNGISSVPGSAPATPAALADTTTTNTAAETAPPTRPQTPNVPQPVDDDGNPIDMSSLAPRPDSPATFAAALQELARDLVTKEQQIEWLMTQLPGADRGQEEQEARIRELDAELRELDNEGERAEEERKRLLERVEGAILGMRRW